MGSEGCRHWCYQCNEPVWAQGSDSVCPYCNGGFVQELDDPWLTNHGDTVRSIYNTIFPPIAAHGHPIIRPPMIPRNHHPISAEFYRQPPVDYRIGRGMPGIYNRDRDRDHYRHHQHHHHHHNNNINEGDDGEDAVIEAIAQMSIDEEEHRGPPRAPEWAIRALPTVQISARHLNGEGKCPVCQEKFQLRSGARQMPCDHIFHSDCIVPWLERHNTCPVCRFELPTSSSSSRGSARGSNVRSRNLFSRLLPRLRQRP